LVTGNSSIEINYKEVYEDKIMKQAKRLYELQDYKNLCEERIKQLIPNHKFPIVPEDLEENMKNNSADIKTNNLNNTLEFENQELNNKLNEITEVKFNIFIFRKMNI
jgi:hypothetical protein